MSHIKVARGIKTDIPFNLLSRTGGVLVDDADWAGGATAPEWPTVAVENSLSVDVTSVWDYNITGDTLPVGAIKHPDPTTGIWRLSTGKYRIRVLVDATQAFGSYTATAGFDPAPGTAKEVSHEVSLVDAGDITFGDLVFASITWADITAVVKSSITDPEQQDIILAEVASSVEGDLQNCGIDTAAYESVPKPVRTMLLAYGRLLVFTYDGSAGLLATELQEGPDRIKFGGRGDSAASRFLGQYQRALNDYCRANAPGRQPMIATIVSDVGHTVNGDCL
jgi:hypothetical protein